MLNLNLDLMNPSVFTGGYGWNTVWTPNYNGLKTYVEIQEWKPEGEFTVECDVYVSAEGRHKYIVANNNTTRYVRVNPDGIIQSNLDGNLHFSDKVYGLGWHTIKLSGNAGSPSFNRIGANHVPDYMWKGQISNLKLIDHDNPANSRFYPGVIYSYVDPDATEVPMPDSTVLVDEWGEGESIFTGSTDIPPLPAYGAHTLVSGLVIGDTYELSFDPSPTTSSYQLLYTSTSGQFRGKVTLLFKAESTYVILKATSESFAAVSAKLDVTKVTHGIMHNFGTDQPWVPLLGDREEYCGSFKRGQIPKYISAYDEHNAVVGSFAGKNLTGCAIVSAGLSAHVILDINIYDKVVDWGDIPSKAAQHAFQYPNTFKVIKPTDPDYPDYAKK